MCRHEGAVSHVIGVLRFYQDVCMCPLLASIPRPRYPHVEEMRTSMATPDVLLPTCSAFCLLKACTHIWREGERKNKCTIGRGGEG